MYDENIMKLAFDISKTSKDPSAQVCAIFTNQNNEILSVGVNKLKENIIESELDYIFNNKEVKKYACDHAEMVALRNLKPTDSELNLYINYPPCLQCAVELVLNSNINIKNLYHIDTGSKSFRDRYKTFDAYCLMSHMKVNIHQIEEGSTN